MKNKPTRPAFHLKDDAFQTLIGDGDWKINEVPLKLAAEIKDHFGIDTSFCVCCSGIASIPTNVGEAVPVGGIDWIRQEDKPRPGEKPLNVYHYLIAQKTSEGYPVFHLGERDTVAPHWSDLGDLKAYFKDWE